MINRLKRLTVFGLMNRLNLAAARGKTQILYRPFFGAIGRRTAVMDPLLIAFPRGIFLGNDVTIRPGARLEIVRRPGAALPKLAIGNNVNIEQNVHIICGSDIRIGNNVSITGGVAIVDVSHPYDDIASPVKVGDRIACDGNFVEIGDHVFIGYGAIIMPNVKIGQRSVIGAYAVVNRDVPDYSVVAGNPARVIKKYCFETNHWVTTKCEF